MSEVRILLLKPGGKSPSPTDQSLGASLAATYGRLDVSLEVETFRPKDLNDLAAAVRRWKGRIDGVVATTNVPESTRLGEVSEELKFLCFVSNNNPAVWQHRRTIFHIGVPTRLTSAAVADQLLNQVGTKRIYLFHDETEFQRRVSDNTGAFLTDLGAEVRAGAATRVDWLDDVRSWTPELIYLVLSDEARALTLVRKLRGVFPRLPLLLGRSLLRRSFIDAVGKDTEALLFVDMFQRGAPRTGEEAAFAKALADAGVSIPTANHGFGWDAMILCAGALARSGANLSAAIEYLESGAELAGATGRYRFQRDDHNGRRPFNPTVLSALSAGRVVPYKKDA
ncbi:MAG TPA: ABC transporter substrate-binding protein [Candidatus Binatia bacterium]|jgi:ABC-type branched-subunit amino acid transport system substrate-binding protein